MNPDPVDPYVFSTHSLPSDHRFLPPLTNGTLGWRVFGEVMHKGGVYNGEVGACHRADIPCPLAVRMKVEDGKNTYRLDAHTGIAGMLYLPRSYFLLLRLASTVCSVYTLHGASMHAWMIKSISSSFAGIVTHTILTSYVEATQMFYAHRQYPNLLVMEVLLKRQRSSEEVITVKLESSFSPHSHDIAFEKAPDYRGGRYV